MREKDFKIDIVYMWVDGRDPKWQEEKDFWAKKLNIPISNDMHNARFFDNQELRFSLRSVEKNMPWINNIFIVTNGQVPEWLNIANSKIHIVNHKEFMPKESLPTFNSIAIEFCIANIPDLSEHFLLANDDCFIKRPVKPSFFFTKDGTPIVRLNKQRYRKEAVLNSQYIRSILNSRELIKLKYGKYYELSPQHNVDAYTKTECQNCIKEFKDEFDKAIYSKFRSESIQRILYSLYMLVSKKAILRIVKPNIFNQCESLSMELAETKVMRKEIKKYSPYLLCINDEPCATNEDREKLKPFLNEMFPERTDFEKGSEFTINKINSDISIVYSVTAEYVKYFGVSLYSLIANSDSTLKYDVVVLDHGIPSFDKIKLKNMIPDNFNLRFIDISNFLFESYRKIHINSMNLYKTQLYDELFIPLLFREYKRILYLHADTCINDNLYDLFNINFEDCPIAAVPHYTSKILYRVPAKRNYISNVLKIKNPEKYFDTGVVLFNMDKINIKQYSEDLSEVSGKADFYYPVHDILNLIYNQKVKLIGTEWNYMYSSCMSDENYLDEIYGDYKKEFTDARKNPKIVHFDFILKPWIYQNAAFSEWFWKYARKSPFYEAIILSLIYKRDILDFANISKWLYYHYYKTKLLLLFIKGDNGIQLRLQKRQLKQYIKAIRKIKKARNGK